MQFQPEVPKIDRDLLRKVSCVPCLTAKSQRAPFSASSRISTRTTELIHLNISCKVELCYDGFLYTVPFLDNFTAKSDAKFLKNKSELFNALVSYKKRFEFELQEFSFKFTNIRIDRAGENLAEVVEKFCSSNGIRLETSPPYAP